MLNIRNKRLLKFVTLMGIGVSLLGAGSVTANASSKYYDGHFDSKRITYHIDSTSKHYRGIWKQAIKNWNDQDVVKLVNTNKKSKANIRMTTVKHIKGDVYTSHLEIFDGDIMSSKIKLDRTYLSGENWTDEYRTNLATGAVGVALGLKSNNYKNSIFANQTMNHITSFDQANLKAAYKGVK